MELSQEHCVVSKLPMPRAVATGAQPLALPRRPDPTVAAGRVYYKGRAVGSYVPKITRKVFEKFGFSTAALLTDWAVIVGSEMAAYTLPERLKWPRGFEKAVETGEPGAGRPGATLVLRVEPARALDVQYKTRLLCDRINAYFGYRAIAEVRLVQAPVPAKSPAGGAPRPSMAPPPASLTVTGPADDELARALNALGASIHAEAANRSR